MSRQGERERKTYELLRRSKLEGRRLENIFDGND